MEDLEGKIVRGVGGFYYVYVRDQGLYECRARGLFRKEGVKPLVGDDCRISVQDQAGKKGNVDDILPRRSTIRRPAVANVDQALLFFSVQDPVPDRNLLDRFLVTMEADDLPVLICFNKVDLRPGDDFTDLKEAYGKAGYPLFFTSLREEGQEGTKELLSALEGKTTALAGPSGVGKSSLINLLQSRIRMETGEISGKLKRGKNTTRHAQLIPIGKASFLCDTPGFSSLDLPEEMKKEDLGACFPDFLPYIPSCRFRGCSHRMEPDCAVKEAVAEGKIDKGRYENYLVFYEDLSDRKRKSGK